jgi:hypothetical protein
MNSNRILNLAAPSNANEPVRLADLSSYIDQLDGTSSLLPAAVAGDVDKIPRVASAGLLGYSGIGIDTADNLRPEITDGGALGTSSLMWSDLFLASGSVINWDNGDLTLTHSANTLTLVGGSLVLAAVSATTGTFSGAITGLSAAVTGALTGATLTTTGAISGDSVAATNAITGATLALSGAATAASLTTTGTIQSSGGAIGYTTGAGGTVTQLTSKATGVTINELSGQITMNNASLAAATEVVFVVTNSAVAATDIPVVAIASGGTAIAYGISVTAVTAGSFTINVTNMSAGALAEALVINFAVIKGVNA